jgi:hypothetical protein
MFGHKKLLTEGAEAKGVITQLTPQIPPPPVQYAGQVTARIVGGYVFQTRVEFDDGATAEVTFETYQKDWADTLEHVPHGFVHRDVLGAEGGEAIFASLEGRLQPGKTVPVRYDAGDRTKIVLDMPALQKEIYSQWPGEQATVPDELAGALGSGPLADILQQASQDPEGLRARLQTQGSGAFVVTAAGVAPLAGAPATQQTDVADQLTKLADLRDRGVLTTAEFEAQKQKLLGT